MGEQLREELDALPPEAAEDDLALHRPALSTRGA
jgi:hypothetical protein